MKKVIGILLLAVVFQASAQTNPELLKHYEAYYAQMKQQGDMQGVINALTHLNVLSPSQARLDTLAVLYMNGGKHMQALNTLGIDANTSDSNMAVEVKAVSLQALNEPEKALVHFEELFKRTPNIMIAYEMADLKIQIPESLNRSSIIVRLSVLETTMYKFDETINLQSSSKETIIKDIENLLLAYNNFVYQINKVIEKESYNIIKP